MRKQRLFAIACALVIIFAVSFLAGYLLRTRRTPVELHGLIYTEPQKAPDFTLTDHHGQNFTLSGQKGKVIALFFGYTHCPDVCPTVMTQFAWILENLGSDKDRIAVVFVTVDPQRDTPEVLRNYLSGYTNSNGITGLTSSGENLEPVWVSYGINVNATTTHTSHTHTHENDYLVEHTGLIFIIDKNLMVREQFLIDWSPKEEILADIQTLLSEA